MHTVEQTYPELRVIWLRNLRIPMRDGITLAADVCRPDSTLMTEKGWAEKLPAVLEYMPYRKNEAVPGARFTEELVREGYIVVRVDLRGTGDSEGITTDEYLPEEQQDGYDTVEWIARQPWCDGQVNIIGLSYGGFTALQIASLQPPHLRTIIPIDFTDNRYTDDCHYQGGLLRMYYDVAFYGNMMVVYNAMPPSSKWLDAEWEKIWDEHLEKNEPYIIEWLTHQTDGSYWQNGSVAYRLDQVTVPAFMFGGWRDGYPNPPLRLYQQLSCPRKAIIGPWNHSWPDKSIPGPRIDFIHEVGRWLDYWCKGFPTGIMDEPSLQVFMQTWQPPHPAQMEAAGTWRAETEYPPQGMKQTNFYIGAGILSPQQTDQQGELSLRYNAQVGIASGLWSGGISFGLPSEQRPDEAYSLQFDTTPLKEDLAIIGRPQVELYTTTSAPVMGYVVRLCEVNEAGVSILVAKGTLNATRRDSLLQPSAVPQGELMRLDIEIDCTGYVFKRGHQIRLSISHADFPNLWPTPYEGTNSIFFGGQTPSRMILPVVPRKNGFIPVEYRPSLRKVSAHLANPVPPVWETVVDHLSGRVTHRVGFKSEACPDGVTLIRHESEGVYSTDPACPEDTTAEGCYMAVMQQPEFTVKGFSHLVIRSTRTDFHLSIDLEVYLNADLKHHRTWERTIPRNLL